MRRTLGVIFLPVKRSVRDFQIESFGSERTFILRPGWNRVKLTDGIGLVQSFVLAVGGKWQVATSYISAVNVPVQLD